MDPAALETALQCFVAVARHHGIDLSADRIRHDYAFKPGDEIGKLLPAIARKAGLRAKSLKIAWNDLEKLGEAYPVIARLSNGNSIVIVGFCDEAVGVIDPLADRPGMLHLTQDMFCKKWQGEVLLLRRNHALADE